MRALVLNSSLLVAPSIAVAMSFSIVGCSSCGGTSSPEQDGEPTATEGSAEGSATSSAAVAPTPPYVEARTLADEARRALAVGRSIEPEPSVVQDEIRSMQRVRDDLDAAQVARECELQVPDACYISGALAMDGTAEGVAALIDDWSRGCTGGDDRLCAALASFLVSVDAGERAAEALGPACDGGVEAACMAMAWARIDQLPDEERDALRRACLDDEPRACRLAAAAHVARDELASAGAAFERGCELYDGPSCTGAVATALALGEAPNQAMRDELARLCAFPILTACVLQGHVAYEPGMETMALYRDVITPWRTACTQGDALSCRDIAWVILGTVPQPDSDVLAAEGSGDTPPSPEVAAWRAAVDEATPWLVTACNLGVGEACMRMVDILETRELNEQEQHLRSELRRRACEAGTTEACTPTPQPPSSPEQE